MYLEVTGSGTIVSEKNNQEYIRCEFRPVLEFLPNGKTVYDGDAKGSKLYNVGKEPNVGDVMKGKLQSFKTTDYTIGDKVVNKITLVVFSNETPVDVANAELERKGACVIIDGKPTKVLEAKPIPTSENVPAGS